ncbi:MULTISPECIES: tryptophan halogenase family protein [Pseudomonas]|uniref:tryptophan halogenase family protein n=1 Tax=Pseudomonas nitroreducens TaxID=46680 RepID=UPI00147F5C45|nr:MULTISPECIES: tryptophan halogenase family protein [Pseudomonas]NNN26032.1 tryptophan 7-halogenase [Pseudomonas nitroreducens]
MLNLSNYRRVAVVGGGSAGWFAALELRKLFLDNVEVVLIESETLGIIGAGEGSLPNFNRALDRYEIDRAEFMRETRSTYKLGLTLEGWRTGTKDDIFFHPFSFHSDGVDLNAWVEPNGSYPLASILLNQNLQLHHFPDAWRLYRDGASQQQAETYLQEQLKYFAVPPMAFHFDARKLAVYLREVALKRGVKKINARVESVRLNEHRHVTDLILENGELAVDFVIDASGLHRLIIDKALHSPWESYSDHLLLNQALPFFIPAQTAHPSLVTRAIAMNNGWMWCIPTQDRLGVGYVYSNQHTDKEGALREAQAYWGMEIEPVNHFAFSPGHFKQVWIGNVMAVGLSSGFVEPLEATSIGQTLIQLARFNQVVSACDGFIPQQLIDQFNRDITRHWDGIRDFLFLHYDTPRQDTEFWRAASSATPPPAYAELKRTFALRPPRDLDLEPYRGGTFSLFGPTSWMSVAAPLGVLTRQATAADLIRLTKEQRWNIGEFLAKVEPRMSAEAAMTNSGKA